VYNHICMQTMIHFLPLAVPLPVSVSFPPLQPAVPFPETVPLPLLFSRYRSCFLLYRLRFLILRLYRFRLCRLLLLFPDTSPIPLQRCVAFASAFFSTDCYPTFCNCIVPSSAACSSFSYYCIASASTVSHSLLLSSLPLAVPETTVSLFSSLD
jgi:hypothetical protein